MNIEEIVSNLRFGLAAPEARELSKVQLACIATDAWPWASAGKTRVMLEGSTGRQVGLDTIFRARELRKVDRETFELVMNGRLGLTGSHETHLEDLCRERP